MKWLDKIYFKWTITKESGEIEDYEISLREYMGKRKKDQLIGISFTGYKWSEPILVIK